MEKAPTLPLKMEAIGDTLKEDDYVLLAQSFVILALYVEKQIAKCGNDSEDVD